MSFTIQVTGDFAINGPLAPFTMPVRGDFAVEQAPYSFALLRVGNELVQVPRLVKVGDQLLDPLSGLPVAWP